MQGQRCGSVQEVLAAAASGLRAGGWHATRLNRRGSISAAPRQTACHTPQEKRLATSS